MGAALAVCNKGNVDPSTDDPGHETLGVNVFGNSEKFTNFGKAFVGSVNIFFQHIKKRNANQVLALADVTAWYALRAAHIDEYDKHVQELPPQDLPEEELKDIQYAYTYARAAYGKVMHEGYMNDAAHLMFATATSAGFALWEDSTGNEDAFLAMAKLARQDVVKWQMAGETLKPAYACILDHAHKRAVLCIRGTLTLHDALTNTVAAAVNYICFDHVLGGTVHKGMLTTSRWLLEQVSSEMVEKAKAFPDYELVVTGHSLGAGVASITTLLLSQDEDGRPRAFGFKGVRGIGFATPGVASKDLALCDVAQSRFTSLCFERDMIVRLCVSKTDQQCYEVCKHSKAQEATEWVKRMAGKSAKSKDEVQREKAVFDPCTAADGERHYPMGKSLFLAKSAGHAGTTCPVRPCSATDFDKIFFHERMFADHILFEYGRSLGIEQ